MQSVTVLTPSGHRKVIKVEPNKTVLWILEDVCAKSKLDPSMYGFKRQNKALDLTQMFRFSGIPNNSSLELYELDKKRVDQDLTLCLSLEDGTRLNGNFSPSTSLRDVIKQMCPEKMDNPNPVVIYMRDEIHGDALDTTTLKSLGLLSGGRALMRLVFTDPEKLKVQQNVSAPLPQKKEEPREESVDRPRPRQAETSSTQLKIDDIKRLKQEKPKEEPEPMEVEDVHEPKTSTASTDFKAKTEEKVTEAQPMREAEPEPVVNILDDRGTIIFSMDSIKSTSLDLPDSFFELTESEVRLLYKDLKNDVDQIENRPLMTAQLRKLEENKKILNQLSIYKSCAIRVQFPSRHVIQTKFSTVSTIGDVIEFLKPFLANPNQNFYLFFTPPKTILDRSTTLIESGAVPSALLHFGSDETITGDVLKPELFEKLSSGFSASRVLMKGCNDDDQQPGGSGETKKSSVPNNFMPSKSAAKTGVVPKWFKPPK